MKDIYPNYLSLKELDMNQKKSLSILASLIGISLQDLELQSANLMGSLGMDSLTATRVRAALIPQPSYQILYGLTVSEVATMLCDISVNQNILEKSETEKCSIPFRLTPMQESYLMGANQGCPCQVYSEFDIENLNIDVFQQAVQFIVNRHPMLHATIVNDLQQAVHSPQGRQGVYFEPLEVDNLDQRRQECMGIFQTNPDLHWDIQFTKLSKNKVRLHLLLNMLFIDATSAMILCHEVASVYRAFLKGNHYSPPANYQLEFWDYCNQLESKQISPSSLNYWEERFSWMPGPPQLPRLKQSGDQIANFQRLAFCLEENEWHALKTYALQLQITPNALLLAIFSEVLRFYSEEPYFSITVTMSERPLNIENNFSGVIGEFTNILLCPIVEQNMPIGAAAQKIHKDLCKSLEHIDFSGLEVVRRLRKYKSDPQLSFPIVFTSFIGVIRPDIELANCKTVLQFQQTQTPQITLDHQVYEWKGNLYVNWDYDSNIYEKALMIDMLHCFHHLLKQVAKDNSCLPSLPPEVIAKRLSINQTNQVWDPAETFLLHDLVFNNANKIPNSIAIIDQDLKFTYQEIIIISRAHAVK